MKPLNYGAGRSQSRRRTDVAGNASSTWGRAGKPASSAVPVRCPDCGWRTERTRQCLVETCVICAGYGFCNKCHQMMRPVPRRAEAQARKAKKELQHEETKTHARRRKKGQPIASRTASTD